MYMSRKYRKIYFTRSYDHITRSAKVLLFIVCLSLILPHVFPVHSEHIAEQNKPALRQVQPTLQPHEIFSGATGRSIQIG